MKTTNPLRCTSLVAALLALHGPLHATENPAADLSLEDLLQTEVVTVSRKSQTLLSTGAAAFVITREDIERSGATSIPEALRMAPGVQVARLAHNRWAVTVRGFNGRFANKLQVLMDGRSIYSTLFSGALWEIEDTLLEDVDRIEVIRGPGAALWGANAVNGVINIITRKARDSQGDLLVGEAGTQERALGAARHGGETADGHYRVWAKAFAREPSVDFDGNEGNDYWRAVRVGARRDGTLANGDRYMLSGEAYNSPSGDRWNFADVSSPQGYTPRDVTQNARGVHLLGRHEWRLADGAEAAIQTYFDNADLAIVDSFRQHHSTFDLDFQHHLPLSARNDFIWGLGWRVSSDRIEAQGILRFDPPRREFRLFSAFLQDEYTVLPDTLRVTAGLRLEHNNYTGFEPQPNLRMVWTPSASQSVWGAVSRAVRTPARAERDSIVELSVTPASPPFQPVPVLLRNAPNRALSLDSEKVNTFELGYRQLLGANLSLDLSAFHSRYQGLRSAVMGAQSFVLSAQPYVVQDVNTTNAMHARTSGVELALDWHPTPGWRLQPSYSNIHLSATCDVNDVVACRDASGVGDSAPRHQLSLRSSVTHTGGLQWDLWLRHVSALDTVDTQGHAIGAYTTLDARAAWRATPNLELSLVGQNLLKRRHAEFVPELLPSQTLQIERGYYVKAKLQF